jgi:hypothetical protein
VQACEELGLHAEFAAIQALNHVQGLVEDAVLIHDAEVLRGRAQTYRRKVWKMLCANEPL